MNRAFLRVLCCAFGLASAAPASADAPSPHAQDGPWQILSVREAGSHGLDYCAAEAEFDGGLVLTLERDHVGRTVLVLQTRAPSFGIKTAYDVRIAVGPSFGARSAGHASDARTLALPFATQTGLLAALARGRSLSLTLPGETDLFALAGAGPAMVDLERCFANASRGRLPATGGIVETVLDRAVTGPIQIAYPAGSTRGQDRDYGWNEGPVAGGAREIEVAAATTFLDLVLTRLDRLVSRCRGRFAPELDAPAEAAGGVFETGIATCREPGADRVAALLYAKIGDRFAEFVLEAPAGVRAAATADRDHIAKIVRTLIPIR